MKRLAVFCLFLIPPVFPAVCRAGNMSLGVGYPYLSLKYDFKALAVEGRFVTGSGVQAYTGRGYWNFHHSDKLKGFAGLEGGYIKFDALDTTGTGTEGAAFVGGEYFMVEKLSLMMDFAPTLITLKSGNTDVNGIEYVINLGLYYHFGESQPKAKVTKAEVIKVSDAGDVPAAGKEPSGAEVRAWLKQLKSPDWQERLNAAFELGKVKAVEAVGPLLKLLEDETDRVCGAAALALGRIGDRRALKPLIERLEDESAYIRASAAKALGDLGDPGAVKALKTALKDDSKKVQKAAEEALKKLGSAP